MEIALRGIGVSPGIAIGPALLFDVSPLDIPRYAVDDPAGELKRFSVAVEKVRQDLESLRSQTAETLGDKHAEIFQAHLMLLDDVTIRQEIEAHVNEQKLNVEFLLDELLTRYAMLLRTVEDPMFRERTNDLRDVGTRILGALLNRQLASLEHIDSPSIVVAHNLSPSDTANIDVANALGIATDIGGPTSHTAILARALEIPAVVGLKHAGVHVKPGDMIILDGSSGYMFVHPDSSTVEEFVAEKERFERDRIAVAMSGNNLGSQTLDGCEVPLLANVELPIEITNSLRAKVQGIGLYRTEYLFLNRENLPTEEEQYQAYAQAAAAMKPYPVTLRTLDIGGDKFISSLRMPQELNPQLGWRAIRFCLERPDIFKAQLRAMLRASVHGNVQIMFPLISGLEDLRRVKAVLEDVKQDLEEREVPFDSHIKIGSMIEVPSAVIVADLLAKECDFFSIGTNDLIQYSLAVDRVNEKIAHMYDPANLAILRMIRDTIRAAKAAQIPCSMCGEMASDPLFTELLIGFGIDSLSMSTVGVPAIHAQVSKIRAGTAKRFANRVMAATTASEIRELLEQRLKRRPGGLV